MNIQEAQATVKAAIESNPQHVLAVCIEFCPSVNEIVNTPEVRAAGPIAATALRWACNSKLSPGADAAARLIAIAERI